MKAKAIVSDVLLLATLVQTFMQSSCHEIHYEGDEPKLIQPRDERTETLLSVIAGNIETLVAEKDRIRALLTVEEIDFLERIAELSDSGKLLDDYVKAESKKDGTHRLSGAPSSHQARQKHPTLFLRNPHPRRDR